MTDLGYSGRAVTGAKYDDNKWISATDIAKGVRVDIKAAVAKGDLPGKDAGFKYRVRSQSFAGGQSVSINIINVNGDAWAFRPVTDSQEDARLVASHGLTKTYTDEALRWGELLHDIGNAYTYQDVDSQVDYFHVTCWINVYLGSGGRLL